MIAGFYLLFAFVKLIGDVPAIIFIQRRGIHVGLAVSFVFYALYLANILGYAQTQNTLFLVMGAIVLGLIDSFGSNARHMYVPAIMKDDTKSSSMATMEIFGQIADFSGPLVGALVGTLFGADWLLGFALFCLVFTIKPLTQIRKIPAIDQSVKLHFSLKNAPTRDVIANACFCSEETISRNLWPVYLAVALGGFSEIGVVTAFSVFGTIVAIWLAGHRGDRGQSRTVLAQGVTGMSTINWGRLVATTFNPIALLGIGYNAAQGYALNGLNTTYYSHAKDKGLPYIVSIEIASDLGYLATWAVLCTVLFLSDSNSVFFASGFIMAATVVWGALLYTPYSPKKRITSLPITGYVK